MRTATRRRDGGHGRSLGGKLPSMLTTRTLRAGLRVPSTCETAPVPCPPAEENRAGRASGAVPTGSRACASARVRRPSEQGQPRSLACPARRSVGPSTSPAGGRRARQSAGGHRCRYARQQTHCGLPDGRRHCEHEPWVEKSRQTTSGGTAPGRSGRRTSPSRVAVATDFEATVGPDAEDAWMWLRTCGDRKGGGRYLRRALRQ